LAGSDNVFGTSDIDEFVDCLAESMSGGCSVNDSSSSRLSSAPCYVSPHETHLVDGITNIIRFGDIPNVKSHIPEHQLKHLLEYTASETYVSKCL
jgi:hypothetical protein